MTFFPLYPTMESEKRKEQETQSPVLESQKSTMQSFPACANFLPRAPSYKAPQRAGSGQG